MIVTIHQPDFAPWLGFFDRWATGDLYVVLDDVQFLRRGWHHRDKVKTAGGVSWLTVPVVKKGRYEQRICDARIDNSSDWRAKHLGTLAAAYGRCAGFQSLFPELERIYAGGHDRLMDFNLDLLRLFAARLGIETPVALASDHPSELTSSARLVELTAIHGGTVYLTGTGSRDYLDEQVFADRGIKVIWQDFSHPVYPQRFGGFEPGMSVIDYLMNGGLREAA
jgi:hypothetical protein